METMEHLGSLHISLKRARTGNIIGDEKSSFPEDLSDFRLENDGFLLRVCSNRAVVDICVLQYSLLDGLLQVCGGFIDES